VAGARLARLRHVLLRLPRRDRGLWNLEATTTAQLLPIMGLTERITIGVFMVWLLAFAMALIRRSRASSH
jgi:hypothetical protein